MKRVFIFVFGVVFLFSAKAYSGIHLIFGTSGADEIILRNESFPKRIAAYVNGAQVLSLPFSNCNANTTVYLSGMAGNDEISVSLSASCPIQCYAYGHAGNDDLSVVGCDSGARVYGGDGDDILELGTSSHYFNGLAYGDNNNDLFYYYLNGGSLEGGSGNDYFGTHPFGTDDYAGYVRNGHISGGEGDDWFRGGPGFITCDFQESQGFYIGGAGEDHWEGLDCYRSFNCDSEDKEWDQDTPTLRYSSRSGCTHIGQQVAYPPID